MDVTPSDTYLSYVLSRPLSEVWNIFLLGLARIVPTIAITPFLGGKMLADPIKIGLSGLIVLIFLPFLIVHTQSALTFDVNFMFLLVKEVFIGSALGFIISVPFFYSQAAGALIDHQRGSQSLQVTDPSTQTQTSPTGTLYNNMMLVTFFMIGGPLLFFDAMFSSYSVIPADAFLPPEFFKLTNHFWLTLMRMFTTIVSISLQLSAPSIIAMLMSDLFLGIANRMAPQVQISFLLWSLKAFIGIALLWASWWLVLKQLNVLSGSWVKVFEKLVHSL